MSLLAVAASFVLGHAQIDPNIVTWRTYKAGTASKAEKQTIEVITSLGAYQRYLGAYAPQGAGDGRDIDWGKEELVAIHLGTRNSGGYSVEVSSIKKVKPNEALVSWAELTPAKGVSHTQALTSPWTIVRLNRPGTRLTFSGTKREGRLPGGIQIIGTPGHGSCRCCEACIRTFERRLPWQIYASGRNSPVVAGSTYVMNSPIEFDSYVRNYQARGLGDGSDIDWYRERLVAIHLGRKLTPGYEVYIDHVDIIDDRRVDVSYVQFELSRQTVVPNNGSGPFVIVRMPRVGSLVTFTKKIVSNAIGYRSEACGCECRSCRHC